MRAALSEAQQHGGVQGNALDVFHGGVSSFAMDLAKVWGRQMFSQEGGFGGIDEIAKGFEIDGLSASAKVIEISDGFGVSAGDADEEQRG